MNEQKTRSNQRVHHFVWPSSVNLFTRRHWLVCSLRHVLALAISPKYIAFYHVLTAHRWTFRGHATCPVLWIQPHNKITSFKASCGSHHPMSSLASCGFDFTHPMSSLALCGLDFTHPMSSLKTREMRTSPLWLYINSPPIILTAKHFHAPHCKQTNLYVIWNQTYL